MISSRLKSISFRGYVLFFLFAYICEHDSIRDSVMERILEILALLKNNQLLCCDLDSHERIVICDPYSYFVLVMSLMSAQLCRVPRHMHARGCFHCSAVGYD